MPIINYTATIIKVFLSIVLLLICATQVSANPFQRILQVDCDGTTMVSLPGAAPLNVGKYWLGDIPRGMLHNKNFYAFDDSEVVVTDIITGKRNSLLNGKVSLEQNYGPWLIGYVDDSTVLFSAQLYDTNVTIDKQRKHYYIYKIVHKAKSIHKVPIDDCLNGTFSFYDNIIFYTNINGVISKYKDGVIEATGLKGDSPIISPNGEKLAYISSGLFGYGVKVYNIQAEKTKTVLRLSGAWPIIRWSSNSRYIAVKKRSDISSNTLFLVDTISRKTIIRFKKNHACNWFFIDEWTEGDSNFDPE